MPASRSDFIMEDIITNTREMPASWDSIAHLTRQAHERITRDIQRESIDAMLDITPDLPEDSRLLRYLKRCLEYDLQQASEHLNQTRFYDFQYNLGQIASYALVAATQLQEIAEQANTQSAAPPADPEDQPKDTNN